MAGLMFFCFPGVGLRTLYSVMCFDVGFFFIRGRVIFRVCRCTNSLLYNNRVVGGRVQDLSSHKTQGYSRLSVSANLLFSIAIPPKPPPNVPLL